MRPRDLSLLVLGLPLLFYRAQADPKPPVDCEKLMKELSGCAANTDKDRRLEAYDALAKSLGFAPKKPGSWKVTTSTSPVDDTKTVLLGLGAEKEVERPTGGSFQPQLVLRCKGGKLDVYTITGIPAGEELPDHRAIATVRFGKDKPVEMRLDRSSEGDALFWPDAAANVERLRSSERLVFQFSPKGYEPVVLEFDLRGIAEIYPQLAEACAKK
jgi:type VI secretion system protein VasI